MNHITLETAKQFKDCKIESESHYEPSTNPYIDEWKIRKSHNDFPKEFPPAYTWQEILIDNPVLFFGEDEYRPATRVMLFNLQNKSFKEAEEYFLKNNIITNRK